MALSIGSTIGALAARESLRRTSSALDDTYARLSSGLRINSAKDDPAGLALSAKLEADTRVATVAIRNTNDGISITSVADSALGAVSNILQGMLELSQQSANGTYTTTQRSAISLEFVALGSEIDRISRTTTFNNISLLSNSSNITVQVGLDSTTNSQITIGAVSGTLASLGLGATGGNTLVYSLITTSDTGSTYASTQALSAVQNAINSLTATRGTIGAAQSRLSQAVSYLEVARENFAAATDKIRSIDVAEEVSKEVSLTIKQQGATAIIAQANQAASLVLELLK